MKVYRKLQGNGAKEHLPLHFSNVVKLIARVLGSGPQDPGLYEDPDLYAEKYLGYNLCRKIAAPYNEENQADRRKAETLIGFMARESVNHKINESETFGYDPATGSYSSDLLGVQLLYEARDIIHDVIGSTPNVGRIVENCAYGNGASATLRRADAQSQKKFEHGLSATSGLLDFSQRLIESSPMWFEIQAPKEIMYFDSLGNNRLPPHHLKRYAGALMDFVPKTKDVDRIILKEPELNGFFQKGIGIEIRESLRKYKVFVPDGIDLSTSGDLNSELAKAGSLQGHIATVDAERASDSLTLALYELLFPEAWYKLLLAARSPYVRLPNGKWHRLAMMSGMGNGFTFEAESLIFYAIGLACSRRSKYPFAELFVSIHGDDLTVPSDVFDLVQLAYSAAGVEVNKAKSFSEGPFRESCGGHYFMGASVKPFYVKFSNGLTRGDWFWLANSLLLWLQDRSPSYLSSQKGKDLIAIMVYLRMYASSWKPRLWATAYDRSRRSGVFSPPPVTRGKAYKTRNIIDEPKGSRFTDAQAYVGWLAKPVRSPSVLDLLKHHSEGTDAYRFNDTVYERERDVRIYSWPFVCKGDLSLPLCEVDLLH